ncbi:MAG: ABC transporter ATP-binding protein [Asgard group archaeon]|nr:ABC transporter ATP-binding protein [Asgard group archaeon]
MESEIILEDDLEQVASKSIAIKTEEISKIFGKTIALTDLTLEIKTGEIFGLLGPNGAGKTTSIRILKGMIKPTSGNAEIFDHKIEENLDWVKQNTGYLPEEGSLMGRLTPLELSEFIGGLFGVPAKISRQRALEFLEDFNLLERKDELIEKLSRGMKQKLSIILSIIHDPLIVFMDEPLASLDPAASRMVKDFIRYLSKEKHKTVLISSHRLSMVEDICDRVAILHQGSVHDIGTPQQIMAKTKTKSLEDAYLALIPGYIQPTFTLNGSLVETSEETNSNLEVNPKSDNLEETNME